MTDFVDPIWGLVAVLTCIFLIFSTVLIWFYVMDKMKLEALKMAKELVEKAAEVEMSLNTTKP